MDAQGKVDHPDDQRRDEYIAGAGTSHAGSGWNKVFGFFDGLRGVTDRVAGLTGDYAEVQENLTLADRLKWELKNDKANADSARQLKFLQGERGDNVQLYYALGAAAVAVVLLTVAR